MLVPSNRIIIFTEPGGRQGTAALPYPGSPAQPQLILTPASASIPQDAAAGTQIATIDNVPTGAVPALATSDARLAISGAAPWRVLRGLGAVTEGATIAYQVTAAGAASASGSVLVTAAEGLALVSAPIIAQSETQITLTSAGVYSGGTVTGRTYTLYRNGANVGPVTLPYTRAPDDAQTSLSVRETATAGAMTADSKSNSIAVGGERPVRWSVPTNLPDGTQLQTLPGWSPRGTEDLFDKAKIVGGVLKLPQIPYNPSRPLSYVYDYGVGNVDIEWQWTVAGTSDAFPINYRYLDETHYLKCYFSSTAGEVAIQGNNGGGNTNNARCRVALPIAPEDVWRLRTENGKVHFYRNGQSITLTEMFPTTGTSAIDPADAGMSLGGAAQFISQWPGIEVPIFQSYAHDHVRLTFRPVDVPLVIETSEFVAGEGVRTLNVGAKVSAAAPNGFVIRVERLDGTTILADTDISLTNVAGVMTGSLSLPEAMLEPHEGNPVIVMLKVKGNDFAVGSKQIDLPDLNASGVIPLHLGINGDHAGTWGSTIIERNLASRARWITADNQDYPVGKVDLNRNFPTEYVNGSSMSCIILENGVYELGEYEITIPAGMTGSLGPNNMNSVVTPFVDGKATVTFTGSSASRSWLWISLTGPIPANAELKVLPKNDPHPERKYHDQLRALLENGKYKFYRYMTPLHTNNNGAAYEQYFASGRGLDSGYRGCRIGTAIQLARDTGTEIWWNFHYRCAAGYVSDVADAVANAVTGIPMGQKIHIEYSNEEWNGGMPGATTNVAAGWMAGYDQGTTVDDAAARPYSLFGWDMSDGGWANATRVAGQDYITKIPIPANAYFFVSIGGYGLCIYRAKQAIPAGTTLPYDAVNKVPLTDANAEVITASAALNLGRRRYTMVRGAEILAVFRAKFAAAGRNPDDVILHCNYQNAAGASGAQNFVADCAYAKIAPSASVQASVAPYYTSSALQTYTSTNTTINTPLDLFLDGAFDLHLGTLEGYASAMKTWKTAAVNAGASNAASSIYEVNQHINGFFTPASLVDPEDEEEAVKNARLAKGVEREAAFKQDPRAGLLLKAFLTRAGQHSPGSVVALFDDVSPKMAAGWGLYNSMGETAAPTNPGGIAVHEWNDAYLNKQSIFDIYAKATPAAGTQTVRVVRTGATQRAETVQLTVSAGASSPMLASEVTGGFGNRTVSFAGGEIWKDVAITTSNTVNRTLKLALTAMPTHGQIGVLSTGGVTQTVRA